MQMNSIISPMLERVLRISSFPLSILAMSRMSFKRLTMYFDDDLILRKSSFIASGLSNSSSANSAMPITPFIGVRKSWLMRERKSLFEALAFSACSMAFESFSFCSFSNKVMSVMSRQMKTMMFWFPFKK